MQILNLILLLLVSGCAAKAGFGDNILRCQDRELTVCENDKYICFMSSRSSQAGISCLKK